MWSDKKLNSYLCLTGHFLNTSSKMTSTVLSFTAFSERHTGKQISCTIKKELKRLQVYEKVRTITCDGASNVRKSFETLKPKRVHCIGHKLHLTVCNAFCLWCKEPQMIDSSFSDEANPSGNAMVNNSSNRGEYQNHFDIEKTRSFW